jgi:DnaJ-class molecular chaperone
MMKVAVPAGIREGKMLRLKGMGRQLAGGQRGDLFLKVVVKI